MFKNILWKMEMSQVHITVSPILFSSHISPQDMELGYMAKADLEPEFVVYAAWDVEPLHRYISCLRLGFLESFLFTLFSRCRLHTLLTEDLSPDYMHLVTQLSELELLRCMDPALLKVGTNNFINVHNLVLCPG